MGIGIGRGDIYIWYFIECVTSQGLPMQCSTTVQRNQQNEKSECVTDHCSYIVMDMGRAREAPRLQVQYIPVAAQCISAWSEWSYPIPNPTSLLRAKVLCAADLVLAIE